MKITPNFSPPTPMPDVAADPMNGTKDPALEAVAHKFEAVFINQMVTEMRKTVTRSGLIPEGPGEKVYQAMLDSDYSEKMANSDQIGLSNMIYKQLVSDK